MIPTRKCVRCGTHAEIRGSSNKPDAYGNRIFICAKCVEKEKIEKNQRIQELITEMTYQMATGTRTYGPCSMEGCDKMARGSAHCEWCVLDKLSEEIDPKKANHLLTLFTHRGEIQSDIDNLIGEIL